MKTTILLLVISLGSYSSAQVSFNRDIKPVFKVACSRCHNGQNPLPNIIQFEVAFKLRNEIVQRVASDRTMPMYGALSESNRDLIKTWVEQGAKK